MTRATEHLVERLVADLRPVRPIPRLRRAAALVAVAGAAALVVGLVVLGIDPRLLQIAVAYPSFGAMLLGLAAIAAGGALAALAAAVPGRESAVRVGAMLAGLGALVAVGLGGALALGGAEASLPPAPLSKTISCLGIATLFAVPSSTAALLFALRGAPLRPLGIAVAAIAGGVGVGALVAHVTCGELSAIHLLAAHALAPGLVAAAAAFPVYALLRRAAFAPH